MKSSLKEEQLRLTKTVTGSKRKYDYLFLIDKNSELELNIKTLYILSNSLRTAKGSPNMSKL